MAALKQDIADSRPKIATRQASQKVLETLVPATPDLVGGSADLTGSNLTLVKGMGSVAPAVTVVDTSITASANMAWQLVPTVWRCMAG